MTVMTQIILAVALVLSIIVPFGYYFIGEKSRGRYKTTIATNAFFFFGTMLVAAMVMFAGSSSVQAATGADAGIATGLGYIAAALVTGLSCIGGGIAVASAASAALGAISEDQSILGKSLIFVGLAEGVALYGLMRLAGVEGVVVHERDELKDALEKAIANKEIGILLLTEKFGREFPQIVDDVKLNHKTPLIIEIPDRHGTGRKPDFITGYVNEAIGLKL